MQQLIKDVKTKQEKGLLKKPEKDLPLEEKIQAAEQASTFKRQRPKTAGTKRLTGLNDRQ